MPEAGRKGDVRELHFEVTPELAERAQLVQLEQAVGPVARGSAAGDDEAGTLQIAEHPRRPARAGGRFPNRRVSHRATLTQACQGPPSGLGRALPSIAV